MPTIIIHNKISELRKIVPFIERFAREYILSEGDVFDLNLAVDEVCTNVIRHAEIKSEKSEIEIDLEYLDNWAVLIIKDKGKEFNPLEFEPYDINTDITDRPIGNLGILLLKSKMDEINYTREGSTNILTMKKKLEK